MFAQDIMRIHHKGGGHSDVPIEQIDSITFVDGSDIPSPDEATLVGSWLWGNFEAGYYELLTFNEDKTYTGYDTYFTYGFDTMTYGWYVHYGSMLTLQSNGYGYRRSYKWYVISLTENALEVMTQMGSFVYYRVQPEVYSLKVGEESYPCSGGEYYVFTDGTRVTDVDGKLKGMSVGTTYILKYDEALEFIMAYKVVVD